MNDERNAGVGFVGADAFEDLQKAVTVAPALHRAQQRRRRVLQRQVEVRHDRRQLEHRRDQRVVHLRRVEVEQPDARQTVRARARRGGAATERANRARRRRARTTRDPARRARPRRRRLDEIAHLGLDRLRPARSLLATERRDGAERARAVAAFGDLDVGPRRVGRGARQLEQIAHTGRSASGSARACDVPARPTAAAIDDSPAKPTTASSSGSASASSASRALRETPGRHELRALLAGRREREDRLDRLFAAPPR